MAGVVEVGDPRVVAIHRQQVLGQVVAAHREEVDPRRQGVELVEGRRHLDHHPHPRPRHRHPLLAELDDGALEQAQRVVDLVDVGDHGQQHLQVVEPLGGAQHGAQLHHQHLGMVQGHADAAPAEEGVGLLDGEVGQVLVAADVQGAHHHRQR